MGKVLQALVWPFPEALLCCVLLSPCVFHAVAGPTPLALAGCRAARKLQRGRDVTQEQRVHLLPSPSPCHHLHYCHSHHPL